MNMKEALKDKFHKGESSRGQGGIFGIFIAIGIGLVIVAVVLGIGATVVLEIQDEMPTGLNGSGDTGQGSWAPVSRNITNETLQGIQTASEWLNIFVIVAIAVAIIGLIFLFAGGVTRGEVRGMSRGGGRRRL